MDSVVSLDFDNAAAMRWFEFEAECEAKKWGAEHPETRVNLETTVH